MVDSSIKFTKIIIGIIILSFATSCILKKDPLYYKTSYEYANEIGPQIINCLLERNREGLKNLFCMKIKDTEYLDKELDFLFNYIDSNGGLKIEGDYSSWEAPAEHGSQNLGEKVVNFVGGDYNGEVLIGNKKYRLRFSAYTILKKYPEYVGVLKIGLFESIDYTRITEQEFTNMANTSNTNEQYLGFCILNFNYENLRDENAIPISLYKDEVYRYTFDELEAGRSDW